MADDTEDKSSKTEDPTERKLNKLREQGNVPRSREVNNFFMLIGMLLALVLTLPFNMKELLNFYGGILSAAGTTRADTLPGTGAAMLLAAKETLLGLLPTLVLFVVLVLFAGVVQTGGPLFSFEPIKPKLAKISLVKGVGRLFSIKSFAEFLKSLLKMLVVGSVMVWVVFAHRNALYVLADKTVLGTVVAVQQILIRLVAGVLVVAALFALLDFLFQKAQYTKEQRMSRKELKDEMKESEGDPFIKNRQRQIRLERARQRMMQEVPKADVVITNPTHFAIALQYKPDEGMRAPKVVAKGADHLAMKIREVAAQHGVPLYEDPPLARQMYAEAEIDSFIPIELYEAVAKVVAYIFSLRS